MAQVFNPDSATKSVSFFLADPQLDGAERYLLLAEGGREGARAVHADRKLGTRVTLAPGDAFVTNVADEVEQITAQKTSLEEAGLTVTLA